MKQKQACLLNRSGRTNGLIVRHPR